MHICILSTHFSAKYVYQNWIIVLKLPYQILGFFLKPKKKFPDGTSLRPGWIVRVVEAIDVIEAAEVPNAREITQYVKCRLYLIFRGLRVIGQILTTQDSQTTFKPNLAAIFLSARDY